MSADFEFYTTLARECLHKTQAEDAVNNFSKALKYARKSGDIEDICRCSFNLGAALLAVGKTPEALKHLELVRPRECDHLFTGDLWYNKCLAHEKLDDAVEAIKCIQQATKCYSECSDEVRVMREADCACKLASLYTQLQEFDKAAEKYAEAASLYGDVNDVLQQTECLFHQAQLLERCKKHAGANAADVAETCVELCSKQPDAGVDIGKLLNDIGHFFAELQKYTDALSCFKQAQKIFQQSGKDRMFEAVTLQNIGAMQTCLGKYDQSIEHNKQAAEIYAEIDCRNEQGQCFSNVAYAYSQLLDIEKAREFYLHATQAAKDTGDRTTEYQALEGLSSVFFQQKKYDRSCEYLKEALRLVSAISSEQSSASQERIIEKLTRVMQTQLKQNNQDAEQQTPVTRTSSVTNNEVAAFDSALPDTSDAPAASSHHAVQVTDTAVSTGEECQLSAHTESTDCAVDRCACDRDDDDDDNDNEDEDEQSSEAKSNANDNADDTDNDEETSSESEAASLPQSSCNTSRLKKSSNKSQACVTM